MNINHPDFNQPVIGVDIGGTTIRCGRVQNGRIVSVMQADVPQTDTAEIVLETINGLITELMVERAAGIGVGVPGIVDKQRGIVFDVVNIRSWKKVYLKEELERRFMLPVHINNDANCFAIGERYFGYGREMDDFVGLVTGTGMGAGIIKNGHLLPDQNCASGEFGIIPYLDKTLEYYCSGNFFKVFYGLSAEEAAMLAEAGEPVALEAFDQYGKHLGAAVKMVMAALDPEAVIIGGGVSRTFRYYEKAMRHEILDFPYAGPAGKIKILASSIDNIAILGASALCHEMAVQTPETG
jgi:glucokinase